MKEEITDYMAKESPAAKAHEAELAGQKVLNTVIHPDVAQASANAPPTRWAAPVSEQNAREMYQALGKQKRHAIASDRAVRMFCMRGLPPALADSAEYKDFCHALDPTYKPSNRSQLREIDIPNTQAFVQKEQLKLLETMRNLTVTFDGGQTRKRHGFYTVHMCNKEGDVFLMDMADGRGVSHTGEWISEVILHNIDKIKNGRQRVAAQASDSTGNTKKSRRLTSTEVPTILNVPDAEHHISLMEKDICQIAFFKPVSHDCD